MVALAITRLIDGVRFWRHFHLAISCLLQYCPRKTRVLGRYEIIFLQVPTFNFRY